MSKADQHRAIAPPPVSADVGLVAATSIEFGPLLDRLKFVRKYAARGQTIIEGRLHGKIVAVVLTGMGRARAQRGAERLIDGHRPRWLLSAGYAGALDPALHRNDLIVPTEVVNVEGRRFPIGRPTAIDSIPRAQHWGRLLTVDEIVLKASEKAQLRSRHDADLVDMETSSVVAYCLERGIDCLSLRIISDEATVDLPPEILSIVGDTGSYRIGAALGAIWRRPSSLKEMLALRETSLESAAILSEAVETLISSL